MFDRNKKFLGKKYYVRNKMFGVWKDGSGVYLLDLSNISFNVS
jgi:hypothetical protein